jgi:hypothetical protein
LEKVFQKHPSPTFPNSISPSLKNGNCIENRRLLPGELWYFLLFRSVSVPNPIELFQLVKGGFAIVGLVAFTIWIMKWFSLYTARHRDLADVEQQTRAALKDALDAHISLGQAKESIFETEIGQLSKQLDALNKALEEKGAKETQLQKQLELVHASADLAREIVKLQSEHTLDKAYDYFIRGMYAVAKGGGISGQRSTQALAAVVEHGPEPEEPHEIALYLLLKLLQTTATMATMGETATTLIPTVLREHIKNPHASASEIFRTWANRSREGELRFVDYHYSSLKLKLKAAYKE